MEQRTLELNIISAKHLQKVNLYSKMDVYAVVSITGDPQMKQKMKTNIDRAGGTHPTWNFPMKFTINNDLASQNGLNLEIKLRCDRVLGDRDIGEVTVPVRELLDGMGDGKSMKFVTYQVRKPSGKGKGELNFSYKFGEKVETSGFEKQGKQQQQHSYAVEAQPPQPVTAYPAAPIAGSSSGPYGAPGVHPPPPQGYPYPPPPAGYGYAYPPPPPSGYYGYPPQQGGYGYPPPQQQQKKSKFGLGLGAGLLGGALGGLLIGDMVSDAASYDAGYDAGFGDAGGF